MTEATAPTTSAPVIPFPKKISGKRAEDKWSPQVLKLGYTALPNLLLRAQAKLKISPPQFNVLAQLCEHWWEADKYPFPAKDTIARRMGKSPRQVQRYITELEEAGLIKRVERFNGKKSQVNNGYLFTGLIKKLKELEPEFSKEVELKKLRKKKLETAKAS
ncbi:helix-turn-helix domain-containing protein [Bradyrhizobium sp. B124]|uniref:helix-turn-helix domain-containing protein n=1 Tax=Bradyrhizobium sp. B124 TaxID=3140245 RepID=UPI00318359CB